MKSKPTPRTLAKTAALFTTLSLALTATVAQGTAFTYQGRLNSGSGVANGSYDFAFTLFATGSGGVALAAPVTNSATLVSSGLFTVAVDFGAGVFTGGSNWLELAVRTNGSGPFNTLTPRQQLAPTPNAIYAANAGSAVTAAIAISAGSASSVPAANITGTLTPSQIPAGVVLDGATGLNLAGTFSGGFGGVTNLNLSTAGFGSSVNRFRFNDLAGSEQVFLHAGRNLDLETVNDGTFWVGRDYTATVDHDFIFHAKHDENSTVDNNRTDTIGLNYALSVGNGLDTTVGGSMSLSVAALLGINTYDLNFQAFRNTTCTTINNLSDTVGQNLTLSVGNNFSAAVGGGMDLTIGKKLSVSTGQSLGLLAASGVGVGTTLPQASLHVYSANNPTVVRVQSTGTPGFGRLEFVSNPQGDVNEWRPGYIQSTDAGGFTGGLAFFVNGTGTGSKFAANEIMRLQNGRVGIGTTAPTTLLQVGAATCNGTTWANGSDRNAKEKFRPVNAATVLAKVAALPLSEWSYKADAATRHIGPMAQDFYAAFNVGPDDKHIATVDADGVALAAIQGLNQKLEDQRAENAELRRELAELKHLVQTFVAKP